MTLKLREVSSPQEMPPIIACLLQSFAVPDISLYQFVCPFTGSTPTAQYDRVLDFSMREWFDHSGDPTSHWVKIVDTDNDDRVVASMRWNIHRRDPFGDSPPKPLAFWLREGPRQRFTEALLYNLCKLRFRKKPHAFIYVSHTHPDYRRQGAGHMMMEWGIRRADELGLECFVEASPLGYQLYSKYGFRLERVAELTPRPEADEDSEEWRVCREELGGLNCAVLRRPVRGAWPASAENIEPKGSLETNIWETGSMYN